MNATTTTDKGTVELEVSEPFPWPAAVVIWSWCASLGLIAGVLAWWLVG